MARPVALRGDLDEARANGVVVQIGEESRKSGFGAGVRGVTAREYGTERAVVFVRPVREPAVHRFDEPGRGLLASDEGPVDVGAHERERQWDPVGAREGVLGGGEVPSAME